MINNASSQHNFTVSIKSPSRMIDPSLRQRAAHRASDSDANVSAHSSGVEKLLAASGLSAVLQASSAVQSPSSSVPPLPIVSSSAPPSPAPAALSAGTLPMLQLLARASAATNNGSLAGAFHQSAAAAAHFHQSLQSANAVNSALSSLAKAIAAGNNNHNNSNNGGIGRSASVPGLAAGIPDLIALSPTASASSSLTSPPSSYGGGAGAGGAHAMVDAAIRKEQIDAALKSKPQRGRKRENLNDHERMELTRTRNREHAKSTRIRKKARHEELLEMESKFIKMEQEQAKNDRCKDLVGRFFLMREEALQTDDAQTPADHHCQVEDVMDENATFVFSNTPALPSSSTLPSAVSAASSSSNSSSEHGEPSTAADVVPSRNLVQQLESFDESIKAKVTRCLGQAALPMLSYAVQGGEDGIALNKSHTAFCRVDLMLAHSLVLIRGIATFEFVEFPSPSPPPPMRSSSSSSECDESMAPSNTTKIASVHWVPIHDATEAGALKSIDPMVIVAMAAESAGALQKMRTEQHSGSSSRLTASNISRHNDQHRAGLCPDVSSSGSGTSSVVTSSKEEAGSERGEARVAVTS